MDSRGQLLAPCPPAQSPPPSINQLWEALQEGCRKAARGIYFGGQPADPLLEPSFQEVLTSRIIFEFGQL